MCSAKRWLIDVDGIVKRGAGSARHAPPRILLIGGSGPLALDGTPDEIGFKAYNLMRMARIGLRVPPAFVIATGYGISAKSGKDGLPEELAKRLHASVHELESITGAGFGSARKPLLLSVRSGAAISMPGMLDTILDVGLNDVTVQGLIRATGNPRLAWDCYRRLVQSFGEVVCGMPAAPFEHALAAELTQSHASHAAELDFERLQKLTASYLDLFKGTGGTAFPQHPQLQLEQAIGAVFDSWNSAKAVEYRKLHNIDDAIGTAVTVQAMVFGNSGGTSGAGVGFTRDPSTGEKRLYMDFLFNAQGEDVVSGRHAVGVGDGTDGTVDVAASELAQILPEVLTEIEAVQRKLEQEFRDVQEFEFTVQDGTLWLLQTRTGKRTPLAQLRTTVEIAEEGLIDVNEALARLAGVDLDSIVQTRLASEQGGSLIACGVPAGTGVATGEISLDVARAKKRTAQGHAVILVRADTTTADIAGIAVARGILTAAGGRTSHAAVVARQLGKACVVSCPQLSIDESGRHCRIGDKDLKEGDTITIDGGTGAVHLGEAKAVEERPEKLLEQIRNWRKAPGAARGRT
jgi:pyruvate,orthophosphate dikinase